MALDDLSESVEEETKKERTEDVAEKLGLEDREELEKMDDRLSDMFNLYLSIDKRLEETEGDLKSIKSEIQQLREMDEAILEILKDSLNEEQKERSEWPSTQ